MRYRLMSLDYDVMERRWCGPHRVLPIEPGGEVLAGREGDLPVAIDPVDSGVSRQAVQIRVGHDHWDFDVLNSNHAWVHPWGQRPTWVESNTTMRKRWPRIGILLVGRDESRHHWVLLESDVFASQWRDRQRSGEDTPTTVATKVKSAAAALTGPQLEAIRTVFDAHLAWPPLVSAEPMLLDSAARRLGIAASAVALRLKQAQNRAFALGPHRQTGVTNPEYVYLLASAGYLPLPGPFDPGLSG